MKELVMVYIKGVHNNIYYFDIYDKLDTLIYGVGNGREKFWEFNEIGLFALMDGSRLIG